MSAAAGAMGRIGPNAITRVAEVLGPAVAREVFAHAGLARYVDTPPQEMVDEDEVIALHQALRADLGEHEARRVAADAGRRTADYLLAHRIPRMAQAVLTRLPAGLAARALLKAIGGHAWTFAGSGRFTARAGRPVVLTIENNPLCRGVKSSEPCCDYYRAVFERLFRSRVHRRAEVVETACEARGDPACVFEIRW